MVEEQELEISLQEIALILWRKAWLIGICLVIGAVAGFGVSRFLITPTYSSRVSMYVNNNKDRTEGGLNINDINASQKLVTTYIEILKSDIVLNEIISQLGLDYSAGELKKMISASSLNNTEILEVKVTSHSAEEAAAIANKIAEVAPPQIIRVVQAGDVQLIDEAKANPNPVAPNTKRNIVIGGALGMIVAVGVVLLLALLDNRVKSGEDLTKKYNLPVLGTIPDILDSIDQSAKGELLK